VWLMRELESLRIDLKDQIVADMLHA
jgi:hypothetical protein